MENLAELSTERRNPRSAELDAMSVTRLLEVMNDEDATVVGVVREAIPQIAAAVELVVAALRGGGRLIYLGAGTSGRLGVVDAVECGPTFGWMGDRVLGVMAGGDRALTESIEDAEDRAELARADLTALDLSDTDVVVGIAASGRTPYVVSGLEYAILVGAGTIALSCNPDAPITRIAQVAIVTDVGPEVLAGSTRLKAGTSQKLVLNMLSTAAMVGVGTVYENLMVDVVPGNGKLVQRATRIIAEATGCDQQTAAQAYDRADGHAKTAIVMVLARVDADQARARLAAGDGFVRRALGQTRS